MGEKASTKTTKEGIITAATERGASTIAKKPSSTTEKPTTYTTITGKSAIPTTTTEIQGQPTTTTEQPGAPTRATEKVSTKTTKEGIITAATERGASTITEKPSSTT